MTAQPSQGSPPAMTDLFSPLSFAHGPAMKNRFMLAPLTNLQSHPDGRLSEDEFRWLTFRAKGGFGLTMTCAAHVQAVGQGFPGQLGIFSDDHLEGLTRLAAAIKAEGSLAVVQLHHAGMRSPKDLIGTAPVAPSDNAETGARGLSGEEVVRLREDFIAAALRAQKAGFDGVEIHGAHSYILCQFLSEALNQRTDAYGGSAENRARLIREIIDGIRTRCRPDFNLGLRLSPERFDLKLADIRDLAQQVMTEGKLDYLDMSLWDVFKEPNEEAFKGRSLMSYFTDLDRGACRLGVAGKIMTADDARFVLEAGADFAVIGRAAILHHDFPRQVEADPGFRPVSLPVTREHLRAEGLGPAFVDYMNTWKGFVAAE
jgi:2,4-dienoyl-CoA reductase-like NADH-dependent reductase (Old Yellow Enzyme family)